MRLKNILLSTSLLAVMASAFPSIGLAAAEKEFQATVINELRLGRSVYNKNCIQCHAANANSKAKQPNARGFWEQRLSTKGIYRMTSAVAKTHRDADGINPYVFEDTEMLRGAVRYLAVGGEAYYNQNINKIKAKLTQLNRSALTLSINKLALKGLVVWGDNDRVEQYSYVGPNYPLGKSLGTVIKKRMTQRLKGSQYMPSLRGEFEPRRDYDDRLRDEAEIHANLYKQIVSGKDHYERQEVQRWLNVIAGKTAIPIDFRYNPDEEVFTFEIWHTPKVDGVIRNEESNSESDAPRDSLSVTIAVPIEAARMFKRRLENEDPDTKPSLHPVYDFDGSGLSLKAVVLLWRDTNQSFLIDPEMVEGSLKYINLSVFSEGEIAPQEVVTGEVDTEMKEKAIETMPATQ